MGGDGLTIGLLAGTAVASAVSCLLAALALAAAGRRRRDEADQARVAAAVRAAVEALPQLLRQEGRMARDDLRGLVAMLQQGLETRLASDAGTQAAHLHAMRREAGEGQGALQETLRRTSETFAQTQAQRLGETSLAMADLTRRLAAAHAEGRHEQKQSLDDLGVRLQAMADLYERRHEAMRDTLHGNLQQLRTDNEAKLEQMRLTVDEKLQGTLEARLGESFRTVSERLDHVHRGLGEMQALATGVGDLKRVLTNVKARGGWGEVQLGALLEDLLTPDQFARNVRVRPDSGELVDYAIRMPGRGEGPPIHLPIDSKFPLEDYERLLAAQEAGQAEDAERAATALERAVRLQARSIADKYVHPPHSTDFAILYLPTEGLFAEVIRRPGLGRDIQNEHRVVVTGPTTLSALLSSLQMGFRTLAIEKRSSEVWQVLGSAKAEFRRYGDVWDKLGKQLDTARKTVDEAGRRTRAVEKRLGAVEMLEITPEAAGLLALLDRADDEPDAAA